MCVLITLAVVRRRQNYCVCVAFYASCPGSDSLLLDVDVATTVNVVVQ